MKLNVDKKLTILITLFYLLADTTVVQTILDNFLFTMD